MASALETLCTAMEAGDPGPILTTFADDVQLHSPALIGPEYRGRDLVGSIVTSALQVLEDIRVTDLLQDGGSNTGVFDARIGELPAQGFILLRIKGERVSEITLLVRPLPALQAFVTRMSVLGAQWARHDRRTSLVTPLEGNDADVWAAGEPAGVSEPSSYAATTGIPAKIRWCKARRREAVGPSCRRAVVY